jgi:selenocysteine-specific elongation factor
VRTHVVATAGHVDHGKSTLVRALTGMEPDRLAEERRRGMTLELGFAWTELPTGDTLAFVDVPGHERFVATMLAGVGPVPAVLFVVAADGGWMPQSAEHLDAVQALGVRHALLAVTRCDLADPARATAVAGERLAAAGLDGTPAVAVSATTGEGMDELRAALTRLAAGLPEPDPEAPVRLWVDRSFTVRGAGTVVTGTLPAGAVSGDDELELNGRRVRVRGLESLGEPVSQAHGVARIAVNLRGIAVDEVHRGDALLTPGAWLEVTELDGRLHGVRDTPPDPAALPAELTLHLGSAAVTARVRPLGGDVLRLRLPRPLPLRIGDRAVLRDPGRRQVLGGLTVLDVRPPALRRRGAAARRAAELAGATGVPDGPAELVRRGTVREKELVAMGVPAELDALRGGGWLLDPGRAGELVERLQKAVAEHDAADPVDPGLPLEAARQALDLPHPALVEALLQRGGGGLSLRDGRVRGAGTELPEPLRKAVAAVRADLDAAPFAAPDAARLAELGLGPRELARLVKAGELVAVADGVVLAPGAEDRAVAVLADLEPVFTLSEARQALGTSRRVAVPLLELLAKHGRTARTEDGRHRMRG